MNDGLVILHTYLEMSSLGFALVFIGIVGCVISLICGIFTFLEVESESMMVVTVILTMIFAIMIYGGTEVPRDHMVKAYAQDTMTMNEIQGKYEIVDIDGMLLTLREKEAQDD